MRAGLAGDGARNQEAIHVRVSRLTKRQTQTIAF
jgi:hypothetical protein